MKDYTQHHMIWDPCLCRYHGTTYMFTLSADIVEGDPSPPWSRADKLAVFAHDGQDFRFVEEIPSWQGHRLTAGSAAVIDDEIYIFYGDCPVQESAFKIGQRLLITGYTPGIGDGYDTTELWLDDQAYSVLETNVVDSRGEPLYAIRDPYYIPTLSPTSRGQHRLLAVSGGGRWGVDPRIIELSAEEDSPLGPYSATTALHAPVFDGTPGFLEVERPSGFYHNGGFHITFSAWPTWITQEFKDKVANIGDPITFSTLWVAKNGRLQDGIPYVPGSFESGTYGAVLSYHQGQPIMLGWDPQRFTVNQAFAYKLDRNIRADGAIFPAALFAPRENG